MASETAGAQPGAQPEPVSMAEASAGMWDVYFGQPAPPAGGVNWEAYSHEELYQMLWQDADVADVSTIAAEWSEHRAALFNHAEVLREQRAALLESWQGTGAEEAARRLDVLADRVEKISELAHAGEQAAEQAADALARARGMMPPPPGDPAAPMTDAVTNWANVMAPLASAPSWSSQPASPQPTANRTTPSTSTSDTSNAFGAVGGAGFSFYVGADSTDMQKQQAIRAMQTYESSLTNSSQLIGQAQGTIPAAATMPSSATRSTSATGKTARRDQSWQSLVGSSDGGRATNGLAAGAAVGALVGGAVTAGMSPGAGLGPSPVNQLAQGMRFGAMPMQGAPGAMAAQLAAESAATRAGAPGGMVPPATGARSGSDDEEHENNMPTIDHELFPAEEPDSEAVIGLPLEDHR
ncbi:hypothetical protein ABZ863_09570 [Saccharomonospora sp. NPDC046836]|uniref:hypothetical protein n=1 Tax=Saccharomonospora sp. NPDC046836 TaxID=3156921 RepID=UPI0033F98F4A